MCLLVPNLLINFNIGIIKMFIKNVNKNNEIENIFLYKKLIRYNIKYF